MNEILGIIVISIMAAAAAVLAWIVLLILIGMTAEGSVWRAPEPILWTAEEERMFRALLIALRTRQDAGYDVRGDVVLLNRDRYARIIREINDNCRPDDYLIGGIRAVLTDDTNDWRLVPRARIFDLGEQHGRIN